MVVQHTRDKKDVLTSDTAVVHHPSVILTFSTQLLDRQHRADHIKTPPDQTTPLSESMEAKAKSGASAPKAASKSDKKEPAPSRKADPAPAAPEPEHPPPQDGAAEAEGAAAGDETATSGTDSLEHLKPFLIGGAVIAAGAILLGVLLLARRN
ncbi:cell cycle exit and neuronal differentiation protein 1-like isoform X2 [Anabas testudineus]|uniref:cell cycle exit and neuronal differentiation protein 1-like isoform X2 n=1 Tax=Anabas testudineus TaxID=64144 RepID=UPI000E464E5F|nr:cell cycle exit and neuronal differentiation protein 1-like isoform X2 [Anabas testudineus]